MELRPLLGDGTSSWEGGLRRPSARRVMSFSVNDFAEEVELYRPSEGDGSGDDTNDLAPAYRDDIGCCRGLGREKHWLALLLTLLLYGVVALLLTDTYTVLHLSASEFRALFLIM
jgi:hypothetical protein